MIAEKWRQYLSALFVIAVVSLCATTLWGYLALDDAHDAADTAIANSVSADRSLDRILAFRGTGPGTLKATKQEQDPRDKIVQALETVSAEQTDSQEDPGTILDQPARRVHGSAYEERLTQIQLHNVTLRQFVTFLCAVSGGTPALRVTELQMTGPGQTGMSDRWSAEATLSYLAPVDITPGSPTAQDQERDP